MKECPVCGTELEMRRDREHPIFECPECGYWKYMTPEERRGEYRR